MSGGVVDHFFGQAVFVQLAIERRAADLEGAGDAGHATAVMLDGKYDGGALDFCQRGNFPRRIEETILPHRLFCGEARTGCGGVDVGRCRGEP